ncbi:FkbM family methyltransferase [Cereibacter sp. SYSU M97828]|nr:FkbM family methyltransferase [Cereibacter flavus]
MNSTAKLPMQLSDITTRLPDWRPQVIFDVGANVGQTASSFAAAFPDAAIHAFEPVPAAFRKLAAVAEANPGVTAHNLALGKTRGTATMVAKGASTANHLATEADPTEHLVEVQMTTGADMAAELGIDRISLLKIDTEGHDFDVLIGFSPILSRTDFVQIEASMNPYNRTHVPFRLLEDFLRHEGFLLFRFYEQTFEFKKQGRPVLRRTNPVFIHGSLVDLSGIR